MSLQQFLRVLRARWLLMTITMVIIIGLTVAISLILPSRYTATASVVIDMKGIDPLTGAVLPILIPASGYIATQIDILSSHRVAMKAVDSLRLAENPSAIQLFQERTGGRGSIRNWLADLLLEDLKVEPSRESSVVNVSYKANDPRFAAAVANAFVRGYVTTNLEFKVEPARHTSAFFTEQVKLLKDNLEAAQAKLSAYQREKGIVATDERLDVENARLNDLSTQYVVAQGQTFDAVTRQRQVQEVLARGQLPDNLPDVLANPVVQGLKANMTMLESKVNDLSSKLGKNHPQLLAARAELDGVKARLRDEMQTITRTLANSSNLAQQREQQIRAALEAQRKKVLETKKLREDVALLLSDVENAQKAYDAVTQRMTTTSLESQTTQTNVLVVNEAVEPIEPSSPNIVLNTIVAIVLSGIIALGLALLREMVDRIIRSDDDVAASIDVPVIGSIPRGRRRLFGRRYKALGGPGSDNLGASTA